MMPDRIGFSTAAWPTLETKLPAIALFRQSVSRMPATAVVRSLAVGAMFEKVVVLDAQHLGDRLVLHVDPVAAARAMTFCLIISDRTFVSDSDAVAEQSADAVPEDLASRHLLVRRRS